VAIGFYYHHTDKAGGHNQVKNFFFSVVSKVMEKRNQFNFSKDKERKQHRSANREIINENRKEE